MEFARIRVILYLKGFFVKKQIQNAENHKTGIVKTQLTNSYTIFKQNFVCARA